MKVALVHDYLNQIGGGERVLDELIAMFPEATVYTLMYDQQKTQERYKNKKIKTSFLDFQFARNHHRLFIPIMPFAARSIRIPDDVDLIISDSAGFGKGIRYKGSGGESRFWPFARSFWLRLVEKIYQTFLVLLNFFNLASPQNIERMTQKRSPRQTPGKTTKHLCYVHTPLRYAWETNSYFPTIPFFYHGRKMVLLKNLIVRFFGALAFWFVRRFDYWAAQQPDLLLANSQYIAGKIKKYYGRDSTVVYPPVDTKKFYFDSTIVTNYSLPTTHYYLAVGRLLHYKRFDLLIDAFTRLGLPLKIIGAGPEYGALQNRLKLITTTYSLQPRIEMPGFAKSDAELRELYNHARGFIMANEEDFGLVTAEAQCCGVPVIAYGKGGSLEIVVDTLSKSRTRMDPFVISEYSSGIHDSVPTGIFFADQTPDSLIAALTEFDSMQFDRAAISQHAQKFSVENFRKGILGVVDRLVG